MKKLIVALLAIALCGTHVDTDAMRKRKIVQQESQEVDLPPCGKQQCEVDSPCQCWCSVKGGPRDWEKGDAPVYANGVCYCTPWDKNHAPGPVSDKSAKKHRKNKANPY